MYMYNYKITGTSTLMCILVHKLTFCTCTGTYIISNFTLLTPKKLYEEIDTI